METKIEKINPEKFGLEEKQVSEIEKAFLPKIEERNGYVGIYTTLLKKEITQETCAEAHELRNKLVKVRTGIADVHRTQKAYFLAAGKFCDAWKNKETLPVTQMELKLKEIENYFENQERERLAKLQAERVELLTPYVDDAENLLLSVMEADVWDAYLSVKKKAWQDEQDAIAKAEADRLAKEAAEAAERERIRKDNERLRAEAIERDRLAKIEADKRAEADRLRIKKETYEKNRAEEARAKERAAALKKLSDEREKAAKAVKIEADKRVKLEAKLKAKEEAEEKAKAEAEAKRQSELSKGDADKINDLIKDIENLKTKYSFESTANQLKYKNLCDMLERAINYLSK